MGLGAAETPGAARVLSKLYGRALSWVRTQPAPVFALVPILS